MARFEYEWYVEPWEQPVLCTLDYQEPNPTAFPGFQGSNARLVAMSLSGKELPIDLISEPMKRSLEIEACKWLEEEGATV